METIFVDFNNADIKGRVRLNTVGSLRSIKEKNIELIQGELVKLDDKDGLINTGILILSKEENIWVVEIDWEEFTRY